MTTLNVPNSLSNGSTADASAVQQNFDAIESHVNTELVNRDGSVGMTGDLLLPGDPGSAGAAARKAYVDAGDSALSTRVSALEGKDIAVTLTGDVTGSATITNLGDVSIATTVAANSVELGSDTTGTFVGSVAAGGGISVATTGTEPAAVTVSHSDTSSQGSVDNTGGTVIQDVTLDTYGHVTALGSKTLTAADVGAAASGHTHDDRYYTETETNNLLSGKADSGHSHAYLPNQGRGATITGCSLSGGSWTGASLILRSDGAGSPDSGEGVSIGFLHLAGGGYYGPQIRAHYDVFYMRQAQGSDSVTLDTYKIQTRSPSLNSSRTIKENIADYSGATAVVDALRPVSFNYVDGDGQTCVGLIAEEVAEVLPIAVSDVGDSPTLNLATVVGVLVAGLKEANARISALEERLAGS